MQLAEALHYVQSAHARGRLAQAYVVVGSPQGAARDFAHQTIQFLNCTAAARPCGSCTPCRQVLDHTFPDMLWIEPQSRSRMIAIEQVRELQRRIQQTAFGSGWKACVISGADRLGDAAANAFLKTLEEPAGQSLFLLLTENPQFLLPTIASRCQEIVLSEVRGESSVWEQRLLAMLTGASARPTASPLLAALGQARAMVELLAEVKEAAEKDVEAEAKEENTEAEDKTLSARASARAREVRAALMRTLLLWQRDQLVLACGADPAAVHYQEALDVLRARATGLARPEALRRVRVVEEMQEQLERNLPEPLVFETGFPRLAGV